MVCRPHVYSREGFQPTIKGSIVYRNVRAAPHNSARSLRQDFCSNSKFRKWRNTVCISHFRNCGSGAKRRLRLADAIVRCCLRIKNTLPLQGRQGIWCRCQIAQYIFRCLPVKYPWTAGFSRIHGLPEFCTSDLYIPRMDRIHFIRYNVGR